MSLSSQLQDHILTIGINRPEAHNALDPKLIKEITQTFKGVEKNSKVRVVVLEGEGPSFCSGGDLRWMKSAVKYNLAQNKKDAKTLSDMYESIFHCPVPVLARVHGNVFGGGVGLTAVCDTVAAERDTKFCLSETRLGLVPSIISPYVLRKMKESYAKLFMYTAETFGAIQAYETGLVQYVGTRDECNHFIQSKAKLISQNAPEAIRKTKELVNKVKISNWNQSKILTIDTISKKRVSKEGQEGMAAFFEKRKPNWQDL